MTQININNQFSFKPVKRNQIPLIHHWLAQDYIKEWLHGDGLQNTLTGLPKFVELYEKEGVIDRKSELTQHWLGYKEETPFAYLLTSNIFDAEDSIYARHKKAEEHAITLDIFIVEPDYLGKGYAPQLIKEFLTSHFSDVYEVFIDPEQSNQRAVHVYQKTGFKKIDEFIAPWHPVPHDLMQLTLMQLQQRQ